MPCFSLATTTVIIAFEAILNLATSRRGSGEEAERTEDEDPCFMTNSKYVVALTSQHPSVLDKHLGLSDNASPVIAISSLTLPTRLSDLQPKTVSSIWCAFTLHLQCPGLNPTSFRHSVQAWMKLEIFHSYSRMSEKLDLTFCRSKVSGFQEASQPFGHFFSTRVFNVQVCVRPGVQRRAARSSTTHRNEMVFLGRKQWWLLPLSLQC